jgi:hypothetical protein
MLNGKIGVWQGVTQYYNTYLTPEEPGSPVDKSGVGQKRQRVENPQAGQRGHVAAAGNVFELP